MALIDRSPTTRPSRERLDDPVEPPPSGRRSSPRRRLRDARAVVLFIGPAFVAYALFIAAPWAHSVWISLFEWDGVGPSTWVGMDNYVRVLTDPELLAALRNGVGLIFFYTVVPIALGLVIAALFAARRGRGDGWVRTILFLPQILPLVAVGVIWRYLYSGDGPVNQVLEAVGLGQVTRAWLGDFDTAFVAVGIVGTWVTTGLCTLLLFTGMQKIDSTLYEAAQLDRCGPIRQFFHVTVPGVRAEIVVACTVTMIAALASFDVIFVTTGGGPGSATTVPGVLIYRLVFTSNQVGLACALATVLSIIILIVVALIGRAGKERS